jgi:hypothetical protein
MPKAFAAAKALASLGLGPAHGAGSSPQKTEKSDSNRLSLATISQVRQAAGPSEGELFGVRRVLNVEVRRKDPVPRVVPKRNSIAGVAAVDRAVLLPRHEARAFRFDHRSVLRKQACHIADKMSAGAACHPRRS